jgi:hypothetical protein
MNSDIRTTKAPRRDGLIAHLIGLPFAILFFCLSESWAQNYDGLKILSDEAPPANSEVHNSANNAKSSITPSIPTPTSNPLSSRRQTLLQNYRQQTLDEKARLSNSVQVMDANGAYLWLSAFISSSPINCPPAKKDQWIESIISAVDRNDLPLSKEILGLTACIISIESGFRTDPLAVDPSRGETIKDLMDRAEQELHKKFGMIMSMPPVPQIYSIYKNRYYDKVASCRTEGDLEIVAREISSDLKKNLGGFPEFLRNIIVREIDKVSNVVRTKGSMQLNFDRAKQVMRDRGEEFSDDDLCDYMYTMQGGIDAGVAALSPMFVQYATAYSTPGNLSWLFFVGMDYHYGPFSSRNMMEQVRIRDLSGKKIDVDGDLLRYDEHANPDSKDSETLGAISAIFPDISKSLILDDLLLEKHPHYAYTNIHELLVKTHADRFGPTPFAVIGDLWMGENAQIKHGTAWKTKAYLNKLDRYLNALPWDK